ncbi:MAG: peptidoglycan DD-metalloendopeptidase family protein [Epsilonproteobacteria bacterium]|nr:peptidoglycan DD-metalloendopeptidase family protein [Campylobacterota bacterium]
MRVVFLFLLLLFGITNGYAAGIDKKIQKTSTQLHSFSKDYKRLNQKMAQTAEAIIRQKRELKKQQKQIAQLEQELKEKSSSYSASKKQLQELLEQKSTLSTQQKQLQKELSDAITKTVSLSIMLDQNNGKNIDSLIELELLKSKLNHYKKAIKKLNDAYYTTLNNITHLDVQAKKLQRSIAAIDKKKKKLLMMQKQKKMALAKLKKDKASYKKALKKLLKKQDELKKTLSRLKIIKIDEEKRKAEAARRKEAFAKGSSVSTKNLPKVKQYGNSYQNIKTKRYKGPKTIAPLRHYTITKKYGTYTDPIYGIKVFNESIAMKPKQKGARVRNVFNGKVIYADKTAMLDYIVIVEHKNGLHTIYANLSQLAPGIKKGKRIKKGYVIGRVNDELIFEVTQRSSHINPIRLFK